MKFKDSKLAHELLDGSDIVIEIGASSHNPFNIVCNKYLNVDLPKSLREVYVVESKKLGEEPCEVHVEANGIDLPFEDDYADAIISSHVIEHFYNPLLALNEWYRVVKPGGYIYIICPHKDRTFDKDREVTSIKEIEARQGDTSQVEDGSQHFTVWRTDDFVHMLQYFGFVVTHVQDVDDKVGNGFTVVIQVIK